MTTLRVVPSSTTGEVTRLQFPAERLGLDWRMNGADEAGHETTIVWVAVSRMLNNGAPGTCTAAANAQYPPSITYRPPPEWPGTGWPIVPAMARGPLELMPPPAASVCQSTA